MSEPQPPLNETPARKEALREVLFGLISYDPLRGVYLKNGAQVTGAKRRTLAELRQHGYIEPGSKVQVAKVALTGSGEQLAEEWGLKKKESAGTVE